jgi:death-on-curing protein
VVEYLDLEDIVAIHHETMRRLGDTPQPLTRQGECLGALNRPRSAAHYENADIITQAARLTVGLAKAHPFVDGNKRTALRCLEIFLSLNGLKIQGDMLEVARLLEQIAGEDTDAGDARLEAWLREHVIEEG